MSDNPARVAGVSYTGKRDTVILPGVLLRKLEMRLKIVVTSRKF